MPRIRTIKPDTYSSESLSQVTIPARFTFVGLWTYADDEGRCRADPRLIKAYLYPLDDDVTAADVAGHLDQLEGVDCIRRYEANGKRYMCIPAFLDHQKISHPTPSKIPAPPADAPRPPHSGDLPESSVSPPEPSVRPPGVLRPEVEREGEREEQPPPTPSVISKTPDQGGGGNSLPRLEGEGAEVAAPSAPDAGGSFPISAVAIAVIQYVAKIWDRSVKALAQLAPRVATVINGGQWQPERLQRHLAAEPPKDGINDAVSLLRFRLNQLPACPDECARACCARRQPVLATCLTHRVEIPLGETCVYCDTTADVDRRRDEQGAAERRQTEADARARLAGAAEQLGPEVIRRLTGRANHTSRLTLAALANWLDDHGWDLDAARRETAGRAS